MTLIVALHCTPFLFFQALVAEGRGSLISAPPELNNLSTVINTALKALPVVVSEELGPVQLGFDDLLLHLSKFWNY